MSAFVTGSQVYGKPHSKSDVDLVVYVDAKTLHLLKKLSDTKKTIRFGKLNIIPCTTKEEWDVWQQGTSHMQQAKKKQGTHFDKMQAKAVLDVLRERVNIKDKGSSLSGEYR